MPAVVEYDRAMRIPVFAVLLTGLFAFPALAQVNGVPPSVTSFGFGGQPGFNGPAPSVTSLGPQGITPTIGIQQPAFFTPQPGGIHHHRHQGYAYPYYVPYYIPYYPMDAYNGPVADQDVAGSPDDPPADRGGPTIFDRRGPGIPARNDYEAEARKAPVPRASAPAAAEKEEATPIVSTKAPEPAITLQPATVLIFKDGHKQEVSNYAIVGTNLFDLTAGHKLKIALSDLDLVATQKANDDLGNEFKLPELPNGD